LVELLAAQGVSPTLVVPGRVVQTSPSFFKRLEERGVELGIHGFDHVDFRALSQPQIAEQMKRAAAEFERSGIAFEGFRCPYLGCDPRVLEAIPNRALAYSSNTAIAWAPDTGFRSRSTVTEKTLESLYRAASADQFVAMPRFEGDLVEVPVSVPDDLLLVDAWRMEDGAVLDAWKGVLQAVHARGELFVLMFHPEALDRIAAALDGVVAEARRLTPAVWITQLRDVATWWREKSHFAAYTHEGSHGALHVEFQCTERATILVRNLEVPEPTRAWAASGRVLEGRSLTVPSTVRPFLGVAADTSSAITRFLREQGYVVETGERARSCAVFLEEETILSHPSEVALIKHIESRDAPLVRFWRWPEGAGSALCLSGDLDALSLMDYLARIRFS